LRYGDVVIIESQIGEFRRSSFDVLHRILKDGAVCVEVNQVRVWIGYDETGAMKSKPIPEEFRTLFFAA
jgi:4-hydroxybenzoyl-CoA thioesterase